MSPARVAAAEVLSLVGRRQGHSDDLLHGPALAGLSQEDRNLATALALGVLRWQIALDAQISTLLARPDVVPAGPVLVALRLGAFQLLHLDRIPPHAAINESVELTRVSGHPHAAGMVNAILRKLSARPRSRKVLHESIASLAQRLGHPAWIVERWADSYGRAAAVAICEFDQREPECGQLFTHETGGVPVMDDGSRLVAEIAAASVPRAERIWDCCAAPGGKALILANRHPEARLLATDASPKRLRFLKERLVREAPQSTVELRVADATAVGAVEGSFDLILCDVPCSGTGTLARNPEIRHQLRHEDLQSQADKQRAILANAWRHLAVGGTLVYSTCSLEPEECEQVVDRALSGAPDAQRLDVVPILNALREKGIVSAIADLSTSIRNGMLRTLPGYTLQADGFFAAAFTRT